MIDPDASSKPEFQCKAQEVKAPEREEQSAQVDFRPNAHEITGQIDREQLARDRRAAFEQQRAERARLSAPGLDLTPPEHVRDRSTERREEVAQNTQQDALTRQEEFNDRARAEHHQQEKSEEIDREQLARDRRAAFEQQRAERTSPYIRRHTERDQGDDGRGF